MAENPIPNFNELLNFAFDQTNVKKEKSYGLKLVKSLWGSFNGGDGYYAKRNAQWKENDEFAKGQVSTPELLKAVGIEENKSWVNYDLKALLRVVPRYMQAILGGFMNREEKPKVDATDILSRDAKAERKIRAQYKLKYKEELAILQQASGQELEPDVPEFEDMDELEMYHQIEDRLPEEMFFEKTIQEIFQNSNYENLKRQCISDLMKKNFAASQIVRTNGRDRSLANSLRVRRCKPDRCIYNIFESPIGEDVSLFGEVYPMSISDVRRKFPQTDEKTLYEIAKRASTSQNLLNFTSWRDTYYSDLSRPYDEYKVPVFDFEVKVADKDYYVKTVNSFGNDIVVKKKGKPNPQNGEVIEDSRFNIYCGTWVLDTDIMLNWSLAPNQIRAYQNGVDCFFTYSVVYPDADGTLIPSLLERGTSCVREMVKCALKIQQMMLLMKPDDVSIDVAGLRDLDIGTGEVLQPIQITKIYDQTGRIYWDSTDVTGTNGEGNRIPFQQIPNSGNAAQINTLIGLYNFWLARLNDEWGTNPDALGQPVPARRTNAVSANMVQAANQATEYIYEAHTELRKQEASKLAMMLWDMIIFNATDYKVADGVNESLINSKFDVNYDLVPIEEDKQWLEQMIQAAIQKGTLSPGQAIRIRNMENVKDAELYLIKIEKKQQKQAAESQNAAIQSNAQAQQQSLQAKAQADSMVKQAEAQAEAVLSQSKTDDAAYLALVNMATSLQVDAQANGLPISDDNMGIIQFVQQRILAQQQQKDQAAQAQAEQQAQAQAQQQQEQEQQQ
jgi:hypothetical protein